VDDTIGSNTGMINFVPTRPLYQIVQEYLRVQDLLYEPDFYLERTYRYFSYMSSPPQKRRVPFENLAEVRALPIFLFKHARLYSSRWKFWCLVIAALFRFPYRLRDFLLTCAAGEHFSQYRHQIRARLQPWLNGPD
jgi:hypothetical protein